MKRRMSLSWLETCGTRATGAEGFWEGMPMYLGELRRVEGRKQPNVRKCKSLLQMSDIVANVERSYAKMVKNGWRGFIPDVRDKMYEIKYLSSIVKIV